MAYSPFYFGGWVNTNYLKWAQMVAGFERSMSWGVPRKKPVMLDNYSVTGTVLGILHK